MGCTIQFESHRGELATISQFEHDPAVLAFYDQPGAIKLVYPSKKGRPVGVLHTPDFFVIRQDDRGWREAFREAEAVYGHGFLGLIPQWNKSGNRLPRLSSEPTALLEKYITDHYETLQQPSRTAVYAQLAHEAQERHIPAPSYRTFCRRIKERPKQEQTLKRQGPRAAAQQEPFYWELEQTTPRHGDRPWEIAHLATAELRKRLQEQAKHQAITAKKLAEFLADARAHEAVLMQRQRDAEAQDVFAQLGGYRKEEPQIEAATPPMPAQRPTTAQEPAEEEPDVYAGLEVYEAYR